MADHSNLKIDRATKHIVELNEVLRKQRPFSYVVETNTKAGERSTFAKKNIPVIQEIALICGDAVHNLRAALDHAYWEIVSPFATTEREFNAIQFPFSKTAARLEEAITNRLAHKVSPAFHKALLDLNLHEELGGNEYLGLIHRLDVIDKHKLLVPTGDYRRLSGAMIQRQVPDFPINIMNSGFGQNYRDVTWTIPPLNRLQRRAMKISESGILEQELNVPVDIVFEVGSNRDLRPMVPTLYQLVDTVKTTISIMRNA